MSFDFNPSRLGIPLTQEGVHFVESTPKAIPTEHLRWWVSRLPVALREQHTPWDMEPTYEELAFTTESPDGSTPHG